MQTFKVTIQRIQEAQIEMIVDFRRQIHDMQEEWISEYIEGQKLDWKTSQKLKVLSAVEIDNKWLITKE